MASEKQLSSVLSEFARTMLTDFPIQGILEHLVRRIVDILPITAAGVTLISPTTGPSYLAASDDNALRYEQLQTELDEGPCLATYRTGKAVLIPDLCNNTRFPTFGPRACQAGLAAVFTFPLRRGDERLGALDLYRESTGILEPDDLIAAQTLADVTAAYLVNALARAELQQTSERSLETSMHDPLTGLPNRLLLIERITHAFKRSRRSHKFVAALFVDIDGFKGVNDTHGHQAGDALLVALSARITDVLRPGDTLARLSGDEFVVVCEELDRKGEAEVIAARIVEAVARPFELDGMVVEISVSIGSACAGLRDNDPEALIHEADLAMYQAKRKGRVKLQLLDRREQIVANSQLGLERDLGQAVVFEELHVEYQPIVRTSDSRITGAEALVRWNHPGRGAISPTTMIALAERSGIIVALGAWVLERACIDRHRWGAHLDVDTFEIAVNVSSHQLMAEGFSTMVADTLARTATPAKLCTLEITESAFVRDEARARVVLDEVKRLGVRIALDDFGTGYSSLNYLKVFPVDVVKLDRSFVIDMAQSRASHAIVAKVIELAHLLDLTVVAEGVETAEQHKEVERLGSDFSQGYYLARPVLPDDLDALMDAGAEGGFLPQVAVLGA